MKLTMIKGFALYVSLTGLFFIAAIPTPPGRIKVIIAVGLYLISYCLATEKKEN